MRNFVSPLIMEIGRNQAISACKNRTSNSLCRAIADVYNACIPTFLVYSLSASFTKINCFICDYCPMTIFNAQKIIFDLDGTLVDTAADLHAATNFVLQSLGRETVSLSQVRHMTGYGAVKLIELGLEATGGTDGLNMESLRKRFLMYYSDNICVHSYVFPDGKNMLRALVADGFQLAVCTNKPIGLALPLLEKLGIDGHFSVITGGDSFPYKKPDPRHILETAQQLAGRGGAVMIGDASPDILGAKAAGIPVIAVDFGYADTPLAELGPDYTISGFADLPALLKYESA